MRFGLIALCLVACSGGSHSPTWTEDVEPLVQQRCDGCHAVGGIAPITLDSYLKARVHGQQMADAARSGRMPPWPPGPKSAALKNSRALAEADIKLIEDWVAGGMPAGPASAHKERSPDVPTVRHDLEVSMAEPYTPPADVTDDYRCFIIDPKADAEKLITAYDVHPGTPGNVHHVILFEIMDQGDALQQLQALDDADPGPGYTCFGGPMVDVSTNGPMDLPPIRFVGGWAPGQGATREPKHTGILLGKNSRLLMQVHYNLLNGRNEDLTTATLELEPKSTAYNEALLIPFPDSDFKIPAGKKYTDTQSFVMPSWVPPFTIYTVYPHMHLLGTSISLSMAPNHDATRSKTLIDVPNWDFHWQGAYELETPVPVKAGDSVSVTCTWDNTAAHQPELHGLQSAPRDVSWGEKTTDEMCLGFLYVTF